MNPLRSRAAVWVLLFAAVSGGTTACSPRVASPTRGSLDKTSADSQASAVQTVRGRIQFYELEGGFWGIVADSGERLRVVGAAGGDWKDGARVVAQVRRLAAGPSLQMWGEPIEIVSVKMDEVPPSPRRE